MSRQLTKKVIDNHGMTLMEVIIGLVLVSILLIAFISVFTSGMYFSIRAGDRTENVSDAAGIIENVLSTSISAGDSDVEIDGETYPVTHPNVTVSFNGGGSIALDGGGSIDLDPTFQSNKVVVTLEGETVKGSKTTTTIEVYK